MENLEEPEERSCAVCARALHKAQNKQTGEVSWLHAEMDFEDHPAVPVGPQQVKTDYRCDFCLSPGVRWVVPTQDFDSGDLDMGHNVFSTRAGSNFACCNACAALIEKNQWSALVMRATKSVEERHGIEIPAEAMTNLSRFYRKVRKNIIGGLRPFDPEEYS